MSALLFKRALKYTLSAEEIQALQVVVSDSTVSKRWLNDTLVPSETST